MGKCYLAETSKGGRGFPSQNSLKQREKGLERFEEDNPVVPAEVSELSQTSHTDMIVPFFHTWELREHVSKSSDMGASKA